MQARELKKSSVTKSFLTDGAGEFWDGMVKGSAPIQMMKKQIMPVRGEPVEPHSNTTGEELWRKKEKLALASLEETLPALKRPLSSDAWLGENDDCKEIIVCSRLFANNQNMNACIIRTT